MSKSARVCILTDSFHPVVGGGENHAFLLCREMVRQGADVLVITRRRQPESARYEEINGYPIFRLRPTGFPRLGKYLMMCPAFWKLIRLRQRYDIIYVCGLRVMGIVGVIAAKLLGKSCVLRSESCGELSGGFIWDSPHGETSGLRKTLLGGLVNLRNRLFMKADAFVSISEVIRQEFLSCGVPTSLIHDITNGIDTELFSPVSDTQRVSLRRQLKLPENATLFAYSGKLNRGKGLPFLLRVWRRLVSERKNVHLLLIGSGGLQFLSCEEELRAYARAQNLDTSITFTGYIASVQSYLQASDFFVFPSENEALGISLIEALSCELSAVASRIGGIVDIVKDGVNGRLAASGAEDEWLGIMKSFLDHRVESDALGKSGRATVMERFGIDRVTRLHLQLFRNLSDAGRGGPR